MAWGKNGTPDTLVSSGDVLTISDLIANIFNVFLSYIIPTGIVDINTKFNNNTNSVYNTRKSVNGTADTTTGAIANIDKDNANNPVFDIMYTASIPGEEKLSIGFTVYQGIPGASNVPTRLEYVSKFVPSPDTDITRIDDENTGATNAYDVDSNLSAFGDNQPDVTIVETSHTTDSVLKKLDNVVIHTTDSILKNLDNLLTHNTDSVLEKIDNLVIHDTDSILKKIDNVLTHDTNSVLKVLDQIVFHTTDSALKKLDQTVTHTTDSLIGGLITPIRTVEAILCR